MQRDVLFLVGGIPENRMFGDKNYFFATPDNKFKELLQAVGKEVPEVEAFLTKTRSLACFGIRIEGDAVVDAIEDGFHVLAGMIDGISLALDSHDARVCHVVFVREGFSNDLDLHVFFEGAGWATFAGTPEFAQQWERRRDVIYERLLRFADIVNGTVTASEITEQIQCSTKNVSPRCRVSNFWSSVFGQVFGC